MPACLRACPVWLKVAGLPETAMESPLLRTCLRRLAQTPHVRRRLSASARRAYAAAAPPEDFQSAPPIRFSSDSQQFSRPRAHVVSAARRGNDHNDDEQAMAAYLSTLRIVPASPSYFTATPNYTDDLLLLQRLERKYHTYPRAAPGQAPRVAWKTIDQYRTDLAEPIRSKGYNSLLALLKELNKIHPALMPAEVAQALDKFKRDVQPHLNIPKPIEVSEHGVAVAVGRRKSSSAKAFVVEGTGECLVNGKPLPDYFARLHDRESAVWALKGTQRLDKYNVWAVASGGGTTGQAEAIALAVGKALLAHEPDLKPAVRRLGCVTRDPRRVERKKPGKLKARKMPAWVKR